MSMFEYEIFEWRVRHVGWTETKFAVRMRWANPKPGGMRPCAGLVAVRGTIEEARALIPEGRRLGPQSVDEKTKFGSVLGAAC